MSFGFGVGDFIAVLDKASKLHDRFADAPAQFKSVSNEVSSLKDVLTDIDNLLTQHELTSWQKKTLDSLIEESDDAITAVGILLDKNPSLDSKSGGRGDRARKTWQRLNWDPKDVQELRARMTFNIELLSRLLDNVTSNVILTTKTSVDRLHLRQDARDRDEEQTRILDWLSNVDFVSQQSDYIKQWQRGTGQWLLSSNHFQQWLETSGRVLFCPGIPGAGKTTLTAVVIDYLLEKYPNEPDIGIAYIYFNFKRKDQQKLDDSLASLLRQLTRIRFSIPDPIKELYGRHSPKQTWPSTNELIGALKTIAKSYTRTFIILDALDECEASDGSRTQIIEHCLTLQAQCSTNLFMTSRFIHEIMEKVSTASTIEIKADPGDVKRFLAGRMSRLPRFVHQDIGLQEEIQEAIIEAVDGMFLLAQLYIDSLCGKRSRKAIREALKKLRGGVEAYDFAYKEAMERIKGQLADEEELAKQVLSWIVCAERPLTTGELQHALAVEIGDSELCEDNVPEVEDMVSVCAGLVALDNQSSVIRLVHYTAQDYLRRTQAQWFPAAEHYITAICITYMSFEAFGDGICETVNAFRERLRSHRLYRYAVQNWGHHAHRALDISHRKCDPYVKKKDRGADISSAKSEDIRRTIMEFLKKEQNLQAAIQVDFEVGYGGTYPDFLLRTQHGITALHWVARLGVLPAAQALLANGETDPNVRDSDGWTPLHYAAMNDQTAIIQLLLENKDIGANIRVSDGLTPLAVAAEFGYEAAVCVLLASEKVNPNTQAENGATPIMLAAEGGHEAIVRFLIASDRVDPMINSFNGQTALSCAAGNGMEDVVRFFLNKGIFDPNLQDKSGATPILLAAKEGHKNVVQLLLANNDVDPYVKDSGGLTLLSLAVASGEEDLVEFLLDQGTFDPNVRDRKGRTPLSYATQYNSDEVARVLLMNDEVDPNIRDEKGLTPFNHAVNNQAGPLIELLLATKKVRISQQDFDRLTPNVQTHWSNQLGMERCSVG